MRTLPDRIRHTILFEAIGLTVFALLGSRLTGQPIEAIGTLGLMFSGLAMSWNLLFNWQFDRWEQKYRPGIKRTVKLRVAHAVLFEFALLTAGAFLITWWLSMPLWDALLLDISSSAFFLIFTFVYNWAYDLVFPIPLETA